ncbi:glycosyltransferase family 2 protein [Humibacillus xanthopallidus]|uniref:glycosyltransferase family 2 protein n=1 Tax=Humibacillus xanthopallidus TaxID=412689 RepID=UPI0038511A70
MAPDDSPPAADLDVVIVSYESSHLIGACLDSIEGARGGLDLTVTVADNASTDGTVALVRGRGDRTRVVEMGRNAGFATANNRAIAAGAARHVLVLNPDTVVTTGALETLVAFADAHPAAGVVAPRLLNTDGSPQLTARAFPTPAAAVFGRRSPVTRWFPHNRWSSRFLVERDHLSAEPFTVDWVSGAAMLVPRSVIESVGAFDEDFFLFWEDADWCRRISRAGHEVWCVPEAVVVHDEGGTRAHGWTPRTIRHFHTGAYRYWAKHHAPQPWNPLRVGAAGLLGARAAALTVTTSIHSQLERTGR